MAAGIRVGEQVTKERSEVAASVQAVAVRWRDPFRTSRKKELNLTSLARNLALASLWTLQPRPCVLRLRQIDLFSTWACQVEGP